MNFRDSAFIHLTHTTEARLSSSTWTHRWGAVAGLALVIGCGPKTTPADARANSQLCADESSDPPPLKARSKIKLPESQLWLHLGISEKAVQENLKSAIPAVLSSERNKKIGAPGRATYRVTRGTPTLHNRKEGLEIQIPIHADISVCKPFAGMCIRYGSCKPSFLARFTIDTIPSAAYRVDPPRAAIHATKRCIIGIDVTNQLEKIARRELKGAQPQVLANWPRLDPLINRGLSELRRPFPISSQECGTFDADKLHFLSPRLARTKNTGTTRLSLVAALGLAGTLRPSEDCKPLPSASSQLPLKRVPRAQQRSNLWVPHRFSDAEVAHFFADAFSGGFRDAPENVLRVENVNIGTEKIALEIRAMGEICGLVQAIGKLVLSRDETTLNFHLESLSKTNAPPEVHNALRSHLNEKPVIYLEGVSKSLIEPVINQAKTSLVSNVKFAPLGLEVGSPQVQFAADGIYAIYPVSAELRVLEF